MTTPFSDLEVDERLRPSQRTFSFDLQRQLDSVVALQSRVPEDAFTADTLGTHRIGNGVVINAEGLVLTIGYLITEAEEVILTTTQGRQAPAHVLGYDQATGFGLVHALEPLDLEPLSIGDSRSLGSEDPVIVAGGGGRSHALAGRVLARAAFAGYWEYLLEEALFTGPAHPHWSGAALIGPRGDVLGIASLRMDQSLPGGRTAPINMCVPAELLPPILEDLSRGRPTRPPRPWLGVFAHDQGSRVLLMDVARGSPAARAELRRGDVIVAVAGKPVASLAEFYARLWELGPPGVDAPLTLRREREVFDVVVRTGDRSAMMRKRRFN